MINFIKQAVESVEGIKSFLFNTDYRNNFDLQNVEFPCCVLTPIMNKKYDLNNIIRESAELQLSVVETAPYEYTGDDLYAINKRCSELALQVIANLQVKSKLDKELTFEFILPSGDELISGVMCNLQCTMKQGSCIGAPSYIEIVVQPFKRATITANGTHIINADKGFNAMREVEVDVQIGDITFEEKIVDITSNGEVEILPTSADAMTKVTANVQVPPPALEKKQVTITSNGITEIVPTNEYGLSKVEVLTDVKSNLQDKSVIVAENGTQTITADSEFEGLSSVEVTTDINTLQGLDFSGIYDAEQADETNQYYKDGIDYAKIAKSLVENSISTNIASLLSSDSNLVFMPNITREDLTNIQSTWYGCTNLLKFGKINTSKNNSLYSTFSTCYKLDEVSLSTNNTTLINYAFNQCVSIRKIILTSIKKITVFTNTFYQCYLLECLKFTDWKQGNISLAQSPKLSPESIHYIIQNAIDVEDGATARTLTLHATAKTNWQNSEYYEQDLAVLEQKGITIA